MSDETTPDLTALLAEHVMLRFEYSSGHILRCTCGAWNPEAHGPLGHNAHVAEQITAAGFGPVRAVEAERDRWEHIVAQVEAERDEAWRWAARRRGEARRFYVAWSSAQMRARERRARAESAEAALAGLQEGVEALALNLDRGDSIDRGIAVDLRALLAPTPDREEARDE